MNQLARSLIICELKAQLNSCEMESRVLAKEIVFSQTPVLRRNEALIQRAKLQTARVSLERRLAALGDRSFSIYDLPDRRRTNSPAANC